MSNLTALQQAMRIVEKYAYNLFNVYNADSRAFLDEMAKCLEQEREQIIESYCQGCADITKNNSIFPRKTSEEYYNETYKGGEQ